MESCDVKVINLHKYKNFNELYNRFNKVRLGYGEREDAKPEDMEEYYSKDEISKYGVIGIEIEKI
jgi:ASC-1-like (ASCH) protein